MVSDNEVVSTEVLAVGEVDGVSSAAEVPAAPESDLTEDAAISDAGSSTLETVLVADPADRSLLSTSFQEYTVTEGLLLLVFVLLLLQFFLNLLRRWF